MLLDLAAGGADDLPGFGSAPQPPGQLFVEKPALVLVKGQAFGAEGSLLAFLRAVGVLHPAGVAEFFAFGAAGLLTFIVSSHMSFLSSEKDCRPCKSENFL